MIHEYKILSISSFSIHGNASLKLIIHQFGSVILPVPCMLFTALTNVPEHEKFELPFEDILRGTLKIARNKAQKLILHIGYLGDIKQVAIIEDVLEEYKELIHAIVVDPVMGDHGRMYVDSSLISGWKRLIKKADYTLPNFTELKILCDRRPDDEEIKIEQLAELFAARYPNTALIATSVPSSIKEIAIYYQSQYESFQLDYQKQEIAMGGTGDLFTASFIVHFYIERLPLKIALNESHTIVNEAIKRSIKEENNELILY